MKNEWRKQEKEFYLPGNKPRIVNVPEFSFFTIKGQGNPNSAEFAEAIAVLYSLSYAVKMSFRKGNAPIGYEDYTVYPLEGLWDLTEDGRSKDQLDKNELIYTIMIRQPDFVSEEFALKIIDQVKKAKPHRLLEIVKFEKITDGACIQILHIGSFDEEPKSFALMNQFRNEQDIHLKTQIHREIYLSDARNTDPSKLKTVLRIMTD